MYFEDEMVYFLSVASKKSESSKNILKVTFFYKNYFYRRNMKRSSNSAFTAAKVNDEYIFFQASLIKID